MKSSGPDRPGAAFTARLVALMLMSMSMMASTSLCAAPLPDEQVPAPLKPWIGWSLGGLDQRACPLAPGSDSVRLCAWPSNLRLELDADGGRFELSARLYAPGWLELPGGAEHWPQSVRSDGAAAPVALRGDRPALWLPAGSHRIEGELSWSRLPESLYVPAGVGLLSLSVDGSARPYPGRDDRGHLWLGRAAAGAAADRHLSLKVFRLVDDDIPLKLTTHIDIEAAGELRDEIIGPVLPPGFVPLSLGGSLPARLDEQNRLHVQLRPGLWSIEVTARAPGPVQALAAPANAAPWPDQEVWSLLAHEDLRVVEAGGAPAIDPRQTPMPEAWTGYPAFLLAPQAQLTLAEKQRGDPLGAHDQLSLQRQIWLDFDGRGYSVQDRLNGRLDSRWRLEATAPLTPGQVLVDGEPQLITRIGEAAAGVEVRHGQLDLVADSRIDEASRSLPVAGWNTDLQGVEASLHLPPGWRLLATSGTDGVPQTWIGRWSLLDLFVVLVASFAAFRLFGIGGGLLTLLALALTWHEPGAPRWAWLNLIAAIALSRALPEALKTGQLPAWLARYRALSLAIVVLIALPFAVQQLRLALYPQLELANASSMNLDLSAADEMPAGMNAMEAEPVAAPMPAPAPQMVRRGAEEALATAGKVEAYGGYGGASVSQQSIQRLDPKLLTQTGPGLPEWSWNRVQLSWSGPITADQRFRLWLSPPWLTRLLQLLGVGLVFAVIALWTRDSLGGRGLPTLRGVGTASAAGALLALAIAPHADPLHAQEVQEPSSEFVAPNAPSPPEPRVLDQLRDRLLAAPDCAPACVQIARLGIELGDDGALTLRLSLDALAAASAPLPLQPAGAGTQGRIWQPAQLLLDGQPAALLRSGDGQLLVALSPGRHEAIVRGSLAGFDQLQLPLPLKPRLVTSNLRGWLLSGVGDQGQVADSLQLLRSRSGDDATGSGEDDAQALPPLLIVTRTLRLGLSWDVETQVRREGVTHTPVLGSVPLLPGEQITGDAVRVVDGRVQLSLAPGQTTASWTSRLPVSPQLQLRAPESGDAVEIWRFDVSPLWHADFDGLPAISRQSENYWLPRFQPWPGEKLTMRVNRPAGVPGRTVTLDSVRLLTSPAQRATDYELSFRLRASQGGQHAFVLPEGLAVQELRVDGQRQPARQEGGKLILPLHPGSQNFTLKLRSSTAISAQVRTLPLDLDLPGVNARLQLDLPPDRWVLWVGGPRLGPAVLFWGVLAVLVIVSAGLARLRLTPLRFWQWALLMIGLSQIPVWAAAIVAGWLVALGARERLVAGTGGSWLRFNLLQGALALLTVIALGLLFTAVAHGLLGSPEMQIAGNGSYASSLQWYQDRWEKNLPTACAISAPLWVYRVLMLLWALWLANALLGWLRWGWGRFTEGGVWRKAPARTAPDAAGGPMQN
ncbi:hypothetical protein [Hydrocarboniphaga effusa]|uniref:hypothetical protein n=1 Tax=Hydrocarboniphaga effusa TaxID=243629 RepID=UPI0035AF137F